jgi:GNAT superfamily N-acetyltransferase
MRTRLTAAVLRPVHGLRPPQLSDAEALGSLMSCAYRSTIDYEGESEAEAIGEIERTFAGEHGAFSWSCSRLIERNGVPVSATLVTHWQHRPLVAFTMTHPDHKGKGLAQACMASAMQALFAAGEFELRLVVTLENSPAVALYRSLGFVPEE